MQTTLSPTNSVIEISHKHRTVFLATLAALSVTLAIAVGVAGAIDRLLLAGEPVGDLPAWTPPRLPVSGGALVARGLAKGPDVARALRALETRWIADGFPDAVSDALLDQTVADAIGSNAAAGEIRSNAVSGGRGRS